MKTKSVNLTGKDMRSILYSNLALRQMAFRAATHTLKINLRSNHFVGKVIDAHLDDRFGQVYVATEENVVAALSADTGAIVWRQVLERGDRGTIKYSHLINDESSDANSVRLNNKRDEDGSLVTVTGSTLILVRGWNVRTGNSAWEWTITPKSAVDSHWFYEKSVLYQVVPSWETSTAEVFEYNVRTGQVLRKTPRSISLQSLQAHNCDFIQSYLIASNNNEIRSTDLRTGVTTSLATTTVRQRPVPVSLKLTSDCDRKTLIAFYSIVD